MRFCETPNDACYKFFVDDVVFLPGEHVSTLCFDLDNCFQSPLADHILRSLPMVAEVTIGQHFVTVRRVDDDDAGAAAREFARKVGVGAAPPEKAARRSAALQRCVTDAMREDESDGPRAEDRREEEQESGELREESVADERLDEAALRDLLLATSWSELKLHVSAVITDHLFSGRPHVDPDAPHPHPDTLPQEGDSELVLILKELIATTIRPQLQADGGDIRFVSLNGGTMYVELFGACRDCKSSKTTLRDLIERTTRHWAPEVREVREVMRNGPPDDSRTAEAAGKREKTAARDAVL